MATVQASYFTKGGTVEWGNCKALSTDNMQIESTVTFPISEQGVFWWMNWKLTKSDGSVYDTYTVYVKATATTIFISERLDKLTSGTYTIDSVNIGRV